MNSAFLYMVLNDVLDYYHTLNINGDYTDLIEQVKNFIAEMEKKQ